MPNDKPGQQSQNPNQKPGQQGQNPNQKPGQQTQNPGQGGKPAPRNKKQTARFGGPLYLVYTVVRCCLQNRLERLCATVFIQKHGPWGATGRNTARRSSSTCLPLSAYRQGCVIGVATRNCTSFPSFAARRKSRSRASSTICPADRTALTKSDCAGVWISYK